MSESTRRDLKALVSNGSAKWFALALAIVGGGGTASGWALLRNESPEVSHLREQVETTKEKRVDNIEADVKALKEGFERMDRNIFRIGERVHAKGLEEKDD